MREYLFRGKQIDNGEWLEGTYLHLNVGKDYICDGTVWIGTLQPCKIEVDPETVGQYTGLTDKNGKKIFEGDVVKKKDILHHDEVQIKGEKYVVQNGSGCWWGIHEQIDYKRAEFLCSFCCGCEVIGNIHDNSELCDPP